MTIKCNYKYDNIFKFIYSSNKRKNIIFEAFLKQILVLDNVHNANSQIQFQFCKLRVDLVCRTSNAIIS